MAVHKKYSRIYTSVMKRGEDGVSVDFCRVLESSGSKWICYRRTKKPDLSVVGVCNGVNVWQQEITESLPSNVTDFTKLRTEDIQLSVNGNTVTLTLSTTNEQYNLKKVDHSTELAESLFSVAERCAKVEERLAEAERTLESLKHSAAASSASAHASVFDMGMDSKKKKTVPKIQPKQAGMSIVNPGSRKRTQAKGVQFD